MQAVHTATQNTQISAQTHIKQAGMDTNMKKEGKDRHILVASSTLSHRQHVSDSR
jgi:hypothetical protein